MVVDVKMVALCLVGTVILWLLLLLLLLFTLTVEAWFPSDCNRIVKSCDSSTFWLIVKRLITLESKNLTEMGLDLQLKRFLS